MNRRMFSNETVEVPGLGDSITEGTVASWEKQVGQYCAADEPVLFIETDKVSVPVSVNTPGNLVEQLVAEEDVVVVGAPLFVIDTSASVPSGGSAATPPTKEAPKAETPASTPAPAATPPKPAPSTPAPAASTTSSAPATAAPGNRNQNRVPMSRMRQRISQRLKEAQNTSASLTTFNEIDMSNIMAVRTKFKDEFLDQHGVKLGFMSAFVKASTKALQANPAVNASVDGKEIIYRDYVDVSVAVASPTGLVVPVLRNTEAMSMADVEKEIQRYGKMARDGTLAMEDMMGGNFTISNGGVFKNMMGTPIINPPQSAILGMHGIFDRPIAVGKEVVVRPMMYVALTYDHRIIDGREAAMFLRTIKSSVEDPIRLLLDLDVR